MGRSPITILIRRWWRISRISRKPSGGAGRNSASPSMGTATGSARWTAARRLAYVARDGGPASARMKHLPHTAATPEIRIDCPDEKKFAIVEAAAKHFAKTYEVLTLDGARISFAHGWGLIRASNT